MDDQQSGEGLTKQEVMLEKDLQDDFKHQTTAGRYSQCEVISMIVGPERKKFFVHISLLRQKSEYFRAALSEQWRRENNKELYLEKEDPDVVETVIDWIYHGTLPKLSTAKLDFSLCLKCYNFAEYRMMYTFKNAIMDTLRKDCTDHKYMADPSEAHQAYTLGLQGTQMGIFLVRAVVFEIMATHRKTAQAWEERLVEACIEGELATDVLRCIMFYTKKPFGAPWENQGCLYHDHSNGSSCEL